MFDVIFRRQIKLKSRGLAARSANLAVNYHQKYVLNLQTTVDKKLKAFDALFTFLNNSYCSKDE